MAAANIVSVWQDRSGGVVRCAAYVDEGGRRGRVEYVAETHRNKDNGTPKTVAELRADLAAALKALRDPQVANDSGVAGITGTLTV